MPEKLKILVTGGGGFLGGYVLRDLVETGLYEVSSIARTDVTRAIFKDEGKQVNWIKADLLDIPSLEEALLGQDLVIHCAAKVSFHRRHRKEMYLVNQTGTANLINCCLDQSIKKFIHISSIAAIGRPPHIQELHEQLDWISSPNNSHYAISKKLAELEVFRGFGEGLEGTILNPSIILGTGYWDQGTANIFHRVYKGLKASPSGRTGFVDVRDVSQAVLKTIQSPSYNDRIILNSTNCSYKELLSKIAILFDKPPPRIAITANMIRWMLPFASLGELVMGDSWRFTREMLNNTCYQYTYSNERSKNVLGISYRSLETTLKDITEVWKMYYPQETTLLPSEHSIA